MMDLRVSPNISMMQQGSNNPFILLGYFLILAFLSEVSTTDFVMELSSFLLLEVAYASWRRAPTQLMGLSIV